ncbi:MAG: hypothetical protein Dbin4_02646, partial [Alphaproteobacteria bacterium]|nr:hypothetical protein [Alphaproteobacteria bacterium]
VTIAIDAHHAGTHRVPAEKRNQPQFFFQNINRFGQQAEKDDRELVSWVRPDRISSPITNMAAVTILAVAGD